MKIACCGTSPYSVRLIPFGDPSWKIWGCSPGLYPLASRLDAWFELHRWEPPVLGVPHMQVPWFSPEYVGWMAQRQHVVWMAQAIPGIVNSKALPVEALVKKYGHYFFTSSLAWMAAMAIEAILLNRELLAANDDRGEPIAPGQKDALGFFGVDMSTEEEYVQQRMGCQFFATMAAELGIEVVVPPESDLLIPAAMYGVGESSPRAIRMRARHDMMKARKAEADAKFIQAHRDQAFMDGQLDAELYHIRTWTHEGEMRGPSFVEIFTPLAKPIPQDPPPPPAPPQPEPVAQAAEPTTLEEAWRAGPTPPAADQVRKRILQEHGLVRQCDPGWCRVKVGEKCDCVGKIVKPARTKARARKKK